MNIEIQEIYEISSFDRMEPAPNPYFSLAVLHQMNQTLDAFLVVEERPFRTVVIARPVPIVGFVRPDRATHFLNSYSLFDHNIELEDGSFWNIRSSDMHKILNWASNDPLSIFPNDRIFGSDYLIQNAMTGETVEADLQIGPIAFGTFTHWVVSIDPWLHRVYLEDGSYWNIRSLDSIYDWAINDTIIIGDGRNEWFGQHDSILINVNLDRYVYAN